MSSGLGLVRFPDGTVKVGCYYGTADTFCARLIDNLDDWYEIKTQPWPEVDPTAERFPVDVWTHYGHGRHWRGEATLDALAAGNDPWGLYGEPSEMTDGNPEWVTEILDISDVGWKPKETP